MAVIGKIRQRSGLVIAIIGFSILAFILTDMFSGKNSLFGGNQEQIVGKMNGKKIQFAEFDQKFKELEQNYQAQYGRLSPELQDIVRDQVWENFFRETVLKDQYKKLKINVSPEELTWIEFQAPTPHPAIMRYFSDPQTGQVVAQFANPNNGQLDLGKVLEYRKNMQPEQEDQWVEFIDKSIMDDLENKKYFTYVSKANYVNSLEAKDEYAAATDNVKAQVVKLEYYSIVDSTIAVTDAELKEYLQKHSEEYQLEASRKLEYVVFDILPTQKDKDDALEWIQEKTKAFKETDKDSAFIVNNGGYYDTNFVRRGSFPEFIEDSIFSAQPGKVYGPAFDQGGYVSIKILETATDTVNYYRASQILIRPIGANKSDTAEAQKKAAEILAGLRKGGDFEAAVKEHSTDPNTNEKGGDFGWISENETQLPKQLISAIAKTRVGEYTLATTSQGVHIIKATHAPSNKKVKVGQIERPIEPSSATYSAVVAKANEFAGSVNTEEEFSKGIDQRGLSKRFAESVKEKDRQLSGIADARNVVMWAYNDERKVGDVSEPFEVDNNTKLVVARLISKSKKGTPNIEEVRLKLTDAVRTEKKAELLKKQFEEAKAGAKNLSEIAQKLGTSVVTIPFQQFNNTSINSVGAEPALLGYLFGSPANKISEPVKGTSGVYVFMVESLEKGNMPEKLDQVKQQMLAPIESSSDVKANEALKKSAEMEDLRYKFY